MNKNPPDVIEPKERDEAAFSGSNRKDSRLLYAGLAGLATLFVIIALVGLSGAAEGAATPLFLSLAGTGVLASILLAVFAGRDLERRAVDDAKTIELRVQEQTLELRKRLQELDAMAHYDALTGLPNRRLFYETMNLFLPRAKRHQNYAALLFIDLDDFKAVNDDYGHDYGDELLRQVALRLNECTRSEDMVARMGGDEFTVILGDMGNPDAAELVARKIIASLKQPFNVLGTDVQIGSSIGIALFPTHAKDRDGLLKAADDMMYAVKKAGKNQYQFFSESLRHENARVH